MCAISRLISYIMDTRLLMHIFHFKFSDTSGVEGAIESDLVEILSSTPSAAETSENDIQ